MQFLYLLLCLTFIIHYCASYKILAIFPYNGRSHHIYFSSIVEELAARGHDTTVINYFPVKKMPNLRQILLQNDNTADFVDMNEHLANLPYWFEEFYLAYDAAQAFKIMANTNCEKLMNNKEIQDIAEKKLKFDVVIVEQFVTDCGLTLAHQVKAPTVGMTAHILMPWTYSRLGATNHPAFVPNHFIGSGTKPDLITTTKSALINLFFNIYYSYVIQRSDFEIVKKFYPDTPDLEELGHNISLILVNQYFPLTGSRLYASNVIEVGGMHIKSTSPIIDKGLENFLNTAEYGVIYISFGSVAKNLPAKILKEITAVLQTYNIKRFLWKVDEVNLEIIEASNNTMLSKWLPQQAILCHPNVVAFITHSGMLSSSEAMHCGVPIVSVPIFGDQFANAAAAVENGLGVTIDLKTLDRNILKEAIDIVLQERYQKRAQQLSAIWRKRPLPPMDTALFWIEHVAEFKNTVDMKPPTLNLPLYRFLLLDVILFLTLAVTVVITVILKLTQVISFLVRTNKSQKKKMN